MKNTRIREAGQGLAEYAFILVIISIIAITALVYVSGGINNLLSNISSSLPWQP